MTRVRLRQKSLAIGLLTAILLSAPVASKNPSAQQATSTFEDSQNPCAFVPESIEPKLRLTAVERDLARRTSGAPYWNRIRYIAQIGDSIVASWESRNSGIDYFIYQPTELIRSLRAVGIKSFKMIHLEVRTPFVDRVITLDGGTPAGRATVHYERVTQRMQPN